MHVDVMRARYKCQVLDVVVECVFVQMMNDKPLGDCAAMLHPNKICIWNPDVRFGDFYPGAFPIMLVSSARHAADGELVIRNNAWFELRLR